MLAQYRPVQAQLNPHFNGPAPSISLASPMPMPMPHVNHIGQDSNNCVMLFRTLCQVIDQAGGTLAGMTPETLSLAQAAHEKLGAALEDAYEAAAQSSPTRKWGQKSVWSVAQEPCSPKSSTGKVMSPRSRDTWRSLSQLVGEINTLQTHMQTVDTAPDIERLRSFQRALQQLQEHHSSVDVTSIESGKAACQKLDQEIQQSLRRSLTFMHDLLESSREGHHILFVKEYFNTKQSKMLTLELPAHNFMETSVENLKNHIQKEYGIPYEQQWLSFEGQPLRNGSTLGRSRIRPSCTLHLSVRSGYFGGFESFASVEQEF